jgi:hypothetical protein
MDFIYLTGTETWIRVKYIESFRETKGQGIQVRMLSGSVLYTSHTIEDLMGLIRGKEAPNTNTL